jgi:hypothetical protein
LNIPTGIISIGKEAFSYCNRLENVYLPDSLITLDEKTFYCCDSLKTVQLPAGLENIKKLTFYECGNLENIVLPEKLKKIGDNAFDCCWSLKNVFFPNSLVEIGNNAFSNCKGLKSIEFKEGLEKIENSAFASCESLEEVIFPSSLKYIGEHAFMSCNLKKVDMKDGVTRIGQFAFAYCDKLEDIIISKNLKEIPYHSFYNCFNLKTVVIPDSVEIIGNELFYNCMSLRKVILSKKIKTISKGCFSGCERLESVNIHDGVEEIEAWAFHNCYNVEKVNLPRTLKKFSHRSFGSTPYLSWLYFNNKEYSVHLDDNFSGFISNPDNFVFLQLNDDTLGFYNNGEYIEFNKDMLLKNEKIKKLIDENKYGFEMYIRLYYWSKKRFIPSNIVIKNMPANDIDKFYINNNGREWAKLINASVNVNLEENKASFFKLCYVLGLFSESTSIRDRAIKFLNKKIVNILDGYTIHSKFDGFDLTNGFNEEYAEFFMRYYNPTDFMEFEYEGDEKFDLIAASYNNFNNVKKIYPNKTLHTNREADLLKPEHVMNAVRTSKYENVDIENEEFAISVGKYGYNQEQFERLQSWYNEGKQITEMELFVEEDKEEKGITYKLLDKQDHLNALLGNITNCCQVVGGVGESCVKYGMSMPNSGFIVFYYNGKIIGQSWVWYDKKSKTICLDNIEIPHRYLEKINQNKTIQKNFINCLIRIENSFKEIMNKKRLEVDKVTIGQGYNDLKDVLDKNFKILNFSSQLNDYDGYSDAGIQYEIKKIEKQTNRK